MKITVMGTGGVGGYFGGRLAMGGADVTFVARGAHLEAMQRDGLTLHLTVETRTERVPAKAVDMASLRAPLGLVLYCVKTTQDAEAMAGISHAVDHDTCFLPLQNGVDSEDTLHARFPGARVLGGTAYVSALVTAPGVVTHYGSGSLRIGDVGFGGAEALRTLAALGERAGVGIKVTEQIRLEKWRKLVWNAGLNPLTALTNLLADQVLADAESEALTRQGMMEVVAVGRALGFALSGEDVAKHLAGVHTVKTFPTSMLSDRRAGRPTEIDAISGPVVRHGEAQGISTPVARMYLTLLRGWNRSCG